ncbi:MAG: FAD-dependent oxidoreductase [Gammaproteobacteria bacterium]|nr:FAD-dependent oxidoreductase [Gammaproteobacteria bacterium]
MARDAVIVVGAGHIGIACAHYLARDGYDVTVIDQGDIGGACSQANCGFLAPSHILPLTTPDAIGEAFTSLLNPRAAFRVRPQLRPELLRWMFEFGRRCTRRQMLKAGAVLHRILDASIDEYRRLFAEDGINCEWHDEGLLFVFRSERALDEYSRTDALLTREFGVTAKLTRGDELAAMEPALLEDLAGAYLYECDGYLRPDSLNASWSAKLQQNGVRFIEQCQLEFIHRNGASISQLDTSQGPMTAGHYVFATGAWTGRWSKALECEIPVEPGKGYSVTMSRPGILPKYPMLMPEKHIGVTPFADGYRIGSMMEFAGFDARIPEFRIRQLQDSARPFLKDPLGPAIEQTWYGWRPMTWDSLPIVGRLPSTENALIATGHNMLGMTLAPVTGRIIADLASERTPDIDIEALSPARFH